jgi:hypothetical protein
MKQNKDTFTEICFFKLNSYLQIRWQEDQLISDMKMDTNFDDIVKMLNIPECQSVNPTPAVNTFKMQSTMSFSN